MTLTKQDIKQIEHDADNIMSKIQCTATEYAKLYECELYKSVINRLEARIDAIQYLREYFNNKE